MSIPGAPQEVRLAVARFLVDEIKSNPDRQGLIAPALARLAEDNVVAEEMVPGVQEFSAERVREDSTGGTMSGDRAEFEQEVLEVVRQWLSSEKVTAPQVFHRVELEGQYPDTEVVVEYSTPPNPTKGTQRYAIWGPLFAGENDPESVGVLIMTWATGG